MKILNFITLKIPIVAINTTNLLKIGVRIEVEEITSHEKQHTSRIKNKAHYVFETRIKKQISHDSKSIGDSNYMQA
jgi:hypothetical protein